MTTKEPARPAHHLKNLQTIDWLELIGHLQTYATSQISAERIYHTSPLRSRREALDSFAEILLLSELLASAERPRFESLDFSVPWLMRLEKASTLKPLELKDTRLFLIEALHARDLLSRAENSLSAKYLELLMDPEEPLSAIEQILTPAGEIRTDASETLYRLTNEKKSLMLQLERTLTRLVKENDMDSILQDRFVTNREGRLVVPVKSGMQHQLGGIIHDSSQTKQTVFMEPQEAIPLNNRVRQIEIEIDEEIERLLHDLSLYLHSHFDELKRTQTAMIELDVRWAQAQLTRFLDAKACSFSEDEVVLDRLFHPLLKINGDPIVTNDVHLDSDRSVLLLSGPNAGGKTVLLKAIGLAGQMARCGLPICAAEGSRLPFFSELHISVGDHQSVDRHLSTFAAHLLELNAALKAKGPGCLLLIDEICGSTDPEEGGALARSFVLEYAKNGIFAVVTSHLGPLKMNWPADSGIVNGSLEYDTKSGRPTYRFLPGVSGQSQAIQTARRVGVENEIVERATEFLSPESREQLKAQDTIERLKAELIAQQEEYKSAQRQAENEKAKYQKLNQKIEAESSRLIEKAAEEARGKLDELLQQAKVQDIFRNNEKVQEIKKLFPTVVKSKDKKAAEATSAEEFGRLFPPGTAVYVPTLKQQGLVQSPPNAKGEITVQSQSMRLQIPWHQLQPLGAHGGTPAPLSPSRMRSGSARAEIHEAEPVIDLRGLRMEEAIEHLETELDSATEKQIDRVKIVHGHGTEALKKAVRNHLSRSTYVESWQAGTPSTGGDGVTWAILR